MFDSTALFRSLYDTGPYGAASSCTLGGITFAGILTPADIEADGNAIIGTHALQYPHGVLLAADDLISIDAETYKVIGVPQRLHNDVTAQLVKQ